MYAYSDTLNVINKKKNNKKYKFMTELNSNIFHL